MVVKNVVWLRTLSVLLFYFVLYNQMERKSTEVSLGETFETAQCEFYLESILYHTE